MEHVDVFQILANPIALALVGYAVLQMAVLYAVHPMRRQMVLIAEEMLAEKHWNEEQREEINLALDASMSFRVGLLACVGALSLILDLALGRPPQETEAEHELAKDPRFDPFIWRVSLSVAASNLIAAAITIPLLFVAAMVALIAQRLSAARLLAEVVEEPVLRVLSSIASSRRIRRAA